MHRAGDLLEVDRVTVVPYPLHVVVHVVADGVRVDGTRHLAHGPVPCVLRCGELVDLSVVGHGDLLFTVALDRPVHLAVVGQVTNSTSDVVPVDLDGLDVLGLVVGVHDETFRLCSQRTFD